MTRPVWMILLGFVMVCVGGIVLPYLMLPGVGVIRLDLMNVALGFILPLFSFGVSVAGLFLGMVGAVMYVRIKKPSQPPSNPKKTSGPSSHS